MTKNYRKTGILFFIFIAALVILSALFAKHAHAKYDRHDGSTYSCNTINSERAYALKHNMKAFKKLNAELKQYCRGY
jgi:hypothetical protein